MDVIQAFQAMLNGGLVDADWSVPIESGLICKKGNIGIYYDNRMVRYLDTNEVPSEEEVLSVFGMDSETLYDRAFHTMSKGLYYENGKLRSVYEDEDEDFEEEEEYFSDAPSASPEEMDNEWDKLPKFISFARA